MTNFLELIDVIWGARHSLPLKQREALEQLKAARDKAKVISYGENVGTTYGKDTDNPGAVLFIATEEQTLKEAVEEAASLIENNVHHEKESVGCPLCKAKNILRVALEREENK